MTSPSSKPGPAACAAGPSAENTPAPIIAPRPTTTASSIPSLRARRLGLWAPVWTLRGEVKLLGWRLGERRNPIRDKLPRQPEGVSFLRLNGYANCPTHVSGG